MTDGRRRIGRGCAGGAEGCGEEGEKEGCTVRVASAPRDSRRASPRSFRNGRVNDPWVKSLRARITL